MAAANTDKFMEVGSPGTATTLSSPGYTSGVSTSVTVGSTSGWPTATGIVFAIDESTTDSNGNEVRVDGTYNEFIGTVASATSITNVDYVTGDAERTYAAGATTRVYIPVSAERENRLTGGILVHANQDGTLKTNAVTSVSLDTTLQTGWQAGSSTWTYASASTFTVPAVDAANMSIGTKIWLTQTTSKYFYVTGVSGTTVTVTAGSDYTVANAAITSPYYSNAATPYGFPTAFACSTTYAGFSANPTSVNSFSINGRECRFTVRTTANGTSNATTFTCTAPVTSATRANMIWYGASKVVNNTVTADGAGSVAIGSATTTVNCYNGWNDNAWTGSGEKSAGFTLIYEV